MSTTEYDNLCRQRKFAKWDKDSWDKNFDKIKWSSTDDKKDNETDATGREQCTNSEKNTTD